MKFHYTSSSTTTVAEPLTVATLWFGLLDGSDRLISQEQNQLSSKLTILLKTKVSTPSNSSSHWSYLVSLKTAFFLDGKLEGKNCPKHKKMSDEKKQPQIKKETAKHLSSCLICGAQTLLYPHCRISDTCTAGPLRWIYPLPCRWQEEKFSQLVKQLEACYQSDSDKWRRPRGAARCFCSSKPAFNHAAWLMRKSQ